MSLNDVTLDLGTPGSREARSSLKGLVDTVHELPPGPVCTEYMNAPAFETRRKAVRTAQLSMETVRGKVQAASLRAQLR